MEIQEVLPNGLSLRPLMSPFTLCYTRGGSSISGIFYRLHTEVAKMMFFISFIGRVGKGFLTQFSMRGGGTTSRPLETCKLKTPYLGENLNCTRVTSLPLIVVGRGGCRFAHTHTHTHTHHTLTHIHTHTPHTPHTLTHTHTHSHTHSHTHIHTHTHTNTHIHTHTNTNTNTHHTHSHTDGHTHSHTHTHTNTPLLGSTFAYHSETAPPPPPPPSP